MNKMVNLEVSKTDKYGKSKKGLPLQHSCNIKKNEKVRKIVVVIEERFII